MRRGMCFLPLIVLLFASCGTPDASTKQDLATDDQIIVVDPVIDIYDKNAYFMVFDGTPYRIGVTFGELRDGGFSLLSGSGISNDTVLQSGQAISATLSYAKNGETLLDVTIENHGGNEKGLDDCRIVRFEMRSVSTKVDMYLANGVVFGDTLEFVTSTFGTDYVRESHVLGTALVYRISFEDEYVCYTFVFGKNEKMNAFSMNDFRE